MYFEDLIIRRVAPGLEKELLFGESVVVAGGEEGAAVVGENDAVQTIIAAHCPTASASEVGALFRAMKRREMAPSEVLWAQGGRGDRMPAFFLMTGHMLQNPTPLVPSDRHPQ